MKILAASAAWLLLLVPTSLWASEPTAVELEDWYVCGREREEAHVASSAKEANQIVTGVVSRVDTIEAGPFAQRAHIAVERVIKGQPAPSIAALMYKRTSPDRDHPDLDRLDRVYEECSFSLLSRQEPYALKTYRYLFYVKDGILIRANGYPVGPPPLEPEEEIRLLDKTVLTSEAQ